MKKNNLFSANNIFGVGREVPMDVDAFMEDMKEVFGRHGVNSISSGSLKLEEGIFIMEKADLDISDKQRMREHPPMNII